ncbi:hypothetical protein DOW39_04780 [Salmonella enterica subsp. enterica serovar Tanger]|nr:hypothetical protein [Salmonella enterica subsp. enterica serovar Tanger]EBV4600985.1 hypothetical protein [Salmonella enterica subsp. enterica serovar Tanger]
MQQGASRKDKPGKAKQLPGTIKKGGINARGFAAGGTVEGMRGDFLKTTPCKTTGHTVFIQ